MSDEYPGLASQQPTGAQHPLPQLPPHLYSQCSAVLCSSLAHLCIHGGERVVQQEDIAVTAHGTVSSAVTVTYHQLLAIVGNTANSYPVEPAFSPVDGSGDADTLSLSARQVDPFLPNLSL